VAVIDPSEADPVKEALAAQGWRPSVIWNTHHHADHVGGNEALQQEFRVDIIGHVSEFERIPGQTRGVEDGQQFRFGALKVTVLHVPGHTRGAVAFLVEDAQLPSTPTAAAETTSSRGGGEGPAVFTGDTLFLGGCGRLFEGTAEQMHASLTKLSELPKATRVYCGHEYTESNLRFAAFVEPGNEAVRKAQQWAHPIRGQGLPTVPRTLADELETNPFLRSHVAEIRRTVRAPEQARDADVFALVRKAKDTFS
jgi:hydroxyacylglutathione hydrolase